MHRQVKDFPQIHGTSDRLQLALDPQTVDRRYPQYQYIDHGEGAHRKNKRAKPAWILSAQQPVKEDPAEDGTDHT